MYLIKGTKYSLEIHQFPDVLNFIGNICLKTRQVLETFEVKIELIFQEILGFFRMTACLPIMLLEVFVSSLCAPNPGRWICCETYIVVLNKITAVQNVMN